MAPSSKPAQDGQAWSRLTPSQRQILAPLEREWPGIEGTRKAKWLEVATRFPAMPADEQQRVQLRMVEWARLTPAERSRARLNFLDSKQLSRDEKQARWEAYKSLPESDRNALAARGRKAERASSMASAPVQALAARSATHASAAAPAAVASVPSIGAARPVAASLVQARPGATTVLMTQAAPRTALAAPAQPKIAPVGAVDPATLLPRSGPQAPLQPSPAQ